ncbi:hypothetical protein [Parahaliea mediterranea]|uniref:hypothetical protein n=1 Tax=Parahaliea mediterranea TaxID=651086 RepID=UPI000E2F81C7|nr:hypothetical protein [Parahaliea mediterranea]
MTDFYRRVRHLYGSAADWATDDLQIGLGEIAFELGNDDVLRAKVGNGTDTFTNLDYLLDPLWASVGNDAYNINSGRVTIGSSSPKDKFSVIGGNHTAGVYRAAIPTDGQLLGGSAYGAFSEADTPNAGATVHAIAAGDWSDTNFGARLRFTVVEEGTTTTVTGMYLHDDKSLDVLGGRFRLRQSHPPASASAPGQPGEYAWDADYEYRCVAVDTWKRTALSTW